VSSSVRDTLLAAIEDHGPISFAEFMEIALYGPGGFYESPPIGEQGHFVTSPHVHPVFGRLVGDALRSLWRELGRPEPLRLIEVGAGDGTLAAQILAALRDVPKHYVAVERSPGARDILARTGIRAAPSLEVLDQRITGCVVANELFDNLPFHVLRKGSKGPMEVRVGLSEGRLVEVERPCNPGLLADFPVPALLPEGGVGVIQLEGIRMLDRMARVIATGYILVIDYAGDPGNAATGPHAYRRQRVTGELLTEPGSRDITVGVDFPALQARARQLGFTPFPLVSQRAALLALGVGAWFDAERRRQADALDRREGREAVGAWSERNAAALLVDPTGPGRLRWLVVATAGLPRPSWLEKAEGLDAEMLDERPAP